jgi:hypothetical protein
MTTANSITASEILDEIIEPGEPSFAPEFARMVLGLRLNHLAEERIRDLLRRNNAGTLNSAEKTALDNYLLVGQFLDLLQAKARASLQRGASAP